MSASTYRDYCNEEQTGRSKRPVISDPIPIVPASDSYSTLPYAGAVTDFTSNKDGGSPSPSLDLEDDSIIPYLSDDNYNSQPTLERSANSIPMQVASPTDTVDTVIHNPRGARSPSNLVRDAPSQRSVGNFEPLIRPEEPVSPPPDIVDDEIHPERNSENQKLMAPNSAENLEARSKNKGSQQRKNPARAYHYTPGSCCYCLSNMPCTNVFLWLCLVIALIGWSVSVWRSVDSMELISRINLRTGYSMDGFPFTDITIIVISAATFLFSIVFLVIASYTSDPLSSYHLPSSQINRCAYCFTTAMAIFSCIAVILWTLIIAVTMIPTTAITIIHCLFKSQTVNCVHLPSYGISTGDAAKASDSAALLQLHCGDDLDKWLTESWDLMTPLIISLGCALLVEVTLMGFVMVVSSNGRHLYERMGYLMSSRTVGDDDKFDPAQRQPFI